MTPEKIHENAEGEKDGKDSDWEEDDKEVEGCMKKVQNIQKSFSLTWNKHKKTAKYLFLFFLVVAYFVYFTFALLYYFGDEGLTSM